MLRDKLTLHEDTDRHIAEIVSHCCEQTEVSTSAGCVDTNKRRDKHWIR